MRSQRQHIQEDLVGNVPVVALRIGVVEGRNKQPKVSNPSKMLVMLRANLHIP